MPEGPLGFPRLSTLGPLSRETEEDLRRDWDGCPDSGKPREICQSIKFHAIAIIQDQGTFPDCKDIVDINSGNCANLARLVYRDVEGVRIWGINNGDHVWIYHDGVHYDAEAPAGVTDPFALPFFIRFNRHRVLHHLEIEAEMENKEPPSSVDEAIEDLTDRYI